MQKAIDIFSCVHGEKNKLAAPVLMIIAQGYTDIDDEDNAIYYARRGYSMYEEVFGKDDSHTADAGNALALLYYFKGLSCSSEEDHKGAIENFSEAIRLDPNKADYFNGRAAAYMKIWDMDKSIADSDEALRLSTTARPE
jgi:tetratricopeptide (TPR) repeat protein